MSFVYAKVRTFKDCKDFQRQKKNLFTLDTKVWSFKQTFFSGEPFFYSFCFLRLANTRTNLMLVLFHFVFPRLFVFPPLPFSYPHKIPNLFLASKKKKSFSWKTNSLPFCIGAECLCIHIPLSHETKAKIEESLCLFVYFLFFSCIFFFFSLVFTTHSPYIFYQVSSVFLFSAINCLADNNDDRNTGYVKLLYTFLNSCCYVVWVKYINLEEEDYKLLVKYFSVFYVQTIHADSKVL